MIEEIVSRRDLGERSPYVFAFFRAASGGTHRFRFFILPGHPAKVDGADRGEAS
jgi:hypothetical protein